MSRITSRRELYKRKRYAVFGCYRCHALQFSNMFQTTHKCPACRKTLQIKRVNPTWECDDLMETIAHFQAMKKKRGIKREGLFITADKL